LGLRGFLRFDCIRAHRFLLTGLRLLSDHSAGEKQQVEMKFGGLGSFIFIEPT
jgi:hypothetical protein